MLLELVAQQADEDLQRVGGGRLPVAPHPVQDDVVAEHLLGVPQQQLEQRELDLGQADHGFVAGHGPAGEVERQVRVAEHLTGRLGAPQQRAHPGQQLPQRERLDQVVVGAGPEAGHPGRRLSRAP